ASAGRRSVATVDLNTDKDENQDYSSSPTPMILHNYYSKTQSPGLRNGVIVRTTVRGDFHTPYHFEGNLTNAQADRFFDAGTLTKAFTNIQAASGTVPTTLEKNGSLIASLLQKIDAAYLARLNRG